jgi:hypothetical protein
VDRRVPQNPGKFFDMVNNYYYLKQGSAPWSHSIAQHVTSSFGNSNHRQGTLCPRTNVFKCRKRHPDRERTVGVGMVRIEMNPYLVAARF